MPYYSRGIFLRKFPSPGKIVYRTHVFSKTRTSIKMWKRLIQIRGLHGPKILGPAHQNFGPARPVP